MVGELGLHRLQEVSSVLEVNQKARECSAEPPGLAQARHTQTGLFDLDGALLGTLQPIR